MWQRVMIDEKKSNFAPKIILTTWTRIEIMKPEWCFAPKDW